MSVNALEIVRLRLSVPLTQAELAQKVSVSEFSIWAIENGKTKNPRPSTIRGIAKALKVSPDVILTTSELCGA